MKLLRDNGLLNPLDFAVCSSIAGVNGWPLNPAMPPAPTARTRDLGLYLVGAAWCRF